MFHSRFHPELEVLEGKVLPATFTARPPPAPALVRTISPERDTVGLAPDQKLRADQLVSLFENSTPEIQYGYVQNLNDGRGFTAGRAGFTTATGDLLDVVRRYTAKQPQNPLKKYLPDLRRLSREESDDTGDLGGFARAWRRAARDPLFLAVQDEVVNDTYFQPAVGHWTSLGLRLPLSLVCLYDTILQHGDGPDLDGLPAVIERTTARAGGTPATGIDEKVWLLTFLQVRRETLLNAHNKATRKGWRQSVSRVAALESIAAVGNYDFHGPITVTVYGDTFTLA